MKKIVFSCILCIGIILFSGCNNDPINPMHLKKENLKVFRHSGEVYLDYPESDEYTWKSTDGRITFAVKQRLERAFTEENDEKSEGIYSVDGHDYNMTVYVHGFSIKMTSQNVSTEPTANFSLEGGYSFGEYFGFSHNSLILVLTDAYSDGIPFYEPDDVIILKVQV